MNTRESDDEQYRWLLDRRRDARHGIRWLRLMVYGACLVAVALIAAGRSDAAGTVTESDYVLLQRSGVPQTPNPASITECLARMVEMIEAEKVRRTSGYVTYKCLDVSQSYVKFSAAAPPPPPPVALRVYACPEAGADGRILESATVSWPNCPTAAFKNPSTSLVVATNDDGVLRWRSALNATGRVWTQTGTVMAWTRVEDINLGTVAPVAGTANLTWTPSPSSGVAGYRLLYGTRVDELVQSIDTIPPSPTALKIEGLAPGPYFFAMQAYTTTGDHGPLSAVLNVTIP